MRVIGLLAILVGLVVGVGSYYGVINFDVSDDAKNTVRDITTKQLEDVQQGFNDGVDAIQHRLQD